MAAGEAEDEVADSSDEATGRMRFSLHVVCMEEQCAQCQL